MTAGDRALARIRAEVADAGRATPLAIRIYVENQVSSAAFQQAVQDGIKMFTARHGQTRWKCGKIL